MSWQPMGTAPKDGTDILTHDGHGNYDICSWCDFWDEWTDYDGTVYPKYWMPLPEPPNEH